VLVVFWEKTKNLKVKSRLSVKLLRLMLVIFLEKTKILEKIWRCSAKLLIKTKNSFDKEKLKSNIKWNQVGWFPDTIKMSDPH
jgi:hypothetical protein